MGRGLRIVLVAAIGAVSGACSILLGMEDLTASAGADASNDGTSADTSPDATGAEAATCSADLMIDDENCGQCGHDCRSGACTGGRCQPVILTSSEVNLDELGVTNDRLLYRANGHVQAIGIDGGLPTTLVPCANRKGLAIIGNGGVYTWCDAHVSLHDITDGGFLAEAGVDGYGGAAADGWFVYQSSTSSLRRTPGTLENVKFDQIAGQLNGFHSVAVTPTQVFYMSEDGTLAYAALASGTDTALEYNQTKPSQIAVDVAIFWATGSDTDAGVLKTKPVAGGPSTTIATGLNQPTGIAIDATHVYLTLRGDPPDYTNGAIVRVPRMGGPVEPLADGLLHPAQIVVTNKFVFWTSRGTGNSDAGYKDGAIYRLAK